MADINQAAWSETDASNASASPSGFPEGMAPSGVDDSMRAVMGAVKRWYDQSGPTLTSGGTANAQTLTYAIAPTGLVRGDVFRFIAGTSNTAAATLNVNALGAIAIHLGAAALTGGELTTGGITTVMYDGAAFQLVGTALPTPFFFGAKGDGATDDTTAVQAAITALLGKTLYLGAYFYKVGPLTINSSINIRGEGKYTSGFVAKTANQATLSITANAVQLKNFKISAAAAGNNTSGTTITIAVGSYNVVEDVYIDSPFIGIDINGGATNMLSRVNMDSATSGAGMSASSVGIRVGHTTTAAGTIDPYILDCLVSGHFGEAYRLEDCGGAVLDSNEAVQTGIGTHIIPSTTQQVSWLFAQNTALGDSTTNEPLLIDTAAATAVVKGLQFTGCWTASSTGASGVKIANTAFGTVNGIHFLGHRSFANWQHGFDIFTGVSNVTIDASQIAGNSVVGVNTADGVALESGASKIAIRNSTINNATDGQGPPNSGTQATGVALLGGNADIMIVGNDLTGNGGNAIFGSTPTGNSVVADNKGVDTTTDSVASAATITLPSTCGSIVAITGTTPITTINGFWNGREVTLIPTTGTLAFNTGGNIGNAVSVPVNGYVRAVWGAGVGVWSMR